jgi:hypothetical protein
MNKVITLSTEASKRLIAKAIVQMPEVQRAFNRGYIALAQGSTCGFIIEELCGYEIVRSRYCRSYISSKGPCLLSAEGQIGFTLFINGEMLTAKAKCDSLDDNENLKAYLKEMEPSDVFIKSGNVMDSAGGIACLVESQDNGQVRGRDYYPPEGVCTIIPMTVSKTIPINVQRLIEILKEEKITKARCKAEPSDMISLTGRIITEIEAAQSLLGVNILPIARDGLGANRSSTTFLLSGDAAVVNNAYNYLYNLQGEPKLTEVENLDCQHCPAYTLHRKEEGRSRKERFFVSNQ